MEGKKTTSKTSFPPSSLPGRVSPLRPDRASSVRRVLLLLRPGYRLCQKDQSPAQEGGIAEGTHPSMPQGVPPQSSRRKLTASITKAKAPPTRVMTIPASAGPSSHVSCKLIEARALARSSSSSATRCGKMTRTPAPVAGESAPASKART